MGAGQIVGVVLIAAGVLWMFVVYFVPEPQRTRGEGTGPWDAIIEIIKRMPVPYLPGALMIIVGALLVGLA